MNLVSGLCSREDVKHARTILTACISSPVASIHPHSHICTDSLRLPWDLFASYTHPFRSRTPKFLIPWQQSPDVGCDGLCLCAMDQLEVRSAMSHTRIASALFCLLKRAVNLSLRTQTATDNSHRAAVGRMSNTDRRRNAVVYQHGA